MTKGRRLLVKELAEVVGVSVRTLHHYDEIGLLRASARSAAGYRLYTEDDVLRLQQILIERELGFGLDEIKKTLDEPSFDRRAALERQKRALTARIEDSRAMLRAIEHALSVLEGNGEKEMKVDSIFEGFDPSKHEEETERRWGTTEAFAESARRTKGYGASEWNEIKEEQGAIYRELFVALSSGKAPRDPEVLAIVERARLSIDRWFYPCSPEMHCSLAELYENDPRFGENIDRFGKGLTSYLCEGIRANRERGGASHGGSDWR